MSGKIDRIIQAGEKAVDELIKVLESAIITHGEDDLSADKMRSAAAAKRLAFEDAIFIDNEIQKLKNSDDKSEMEKKAAEIPVSFAESRAKGK